MKKEYIPPELIVKRYRAKYESTMNILGGRPTIDVTDSYIKDIAEGTLGDKWTALTDKEREDELKAWKKKSITVFRRLPNGQLAFGANQMKAAMKEVNSVFGLKLGKENMQHGIWVGGVNVDGEAMLPLWRGDKPIMKPDGTMENFIPPTYNNPRACIKVWEKISPVAWFEAIVEVRVPKVNSVMKSLMSAVDAVGSGRGQQCGRVKLVEFEELEQIKF